MSFSNLFSPLEIGQTLVSILFKITGFLRLIYCDVLTEGKGKHAVFEYMFY